MTDSNVLPTLRDAHRLIEDAIERSRQAQGICQQLETLIDSGSLMLARYGAGATLTRLQLEQQANHLRSLLPLWRAADIETHPDHARNALLLNGLLSHRELNHADTELNGLAIYASTDGHAGPDDERTMRKLDELVQDAKRYAELVNQDYNNAHTVATIALSQRLAQLSIPALVTAAAPEQSPPDLGPAL